MRSVLLALAASAGLLLAGCGAPPVAGFENTPPLQGEQIRSLLAGRTVILTGTTRAQNTGRSVVMKFEPNGTGKLTRRPGNSRSAFFWEVENGKLCAGSSELNRQCGDVFATGNRIAIQYNRGDQYETLLGTVS